MATCLPAIASSWALSEWGARVAATCGAYSTLTTCEWSVSATCKQTRRQNAKKSVDARYGEDTCTAYNDFRELLARPDIDAVLIAVPDHWHALIGLEAARNGKHMYYEKPMGVSFAEAKAMREAVKRHGVTFQFGTQQRSQQQYRVSRRVGAERQDRAVERDSDRLGQFAVHPQPARTAHSTGIRL